MAMESITQIAHKINKGEIKISDVPEFRRHRVSRYLATVPPDTIEIMAQKENIRAGIEKPKAPRSKFIQTSKVRFGRTY
jgi:hypothetical protein